MIKWFEFHSKVSWLIVILIAIGIFYVSSQTFPPSQTGSQLKPIIYHITAFFLFSSFLMFALVKGENNFLIILAVAIAIFYGITDEIHQSFILGRHASLTDILVDNVGITFSFLIYMISLELRK